MVLYLGFSTARLLIHWTHFLHIAGLHDPFSESFITSMGEWCQPSWINSNVHGNSTDLYADDTLTILFASIWGCLNWHENYYIAKYNSRSFTIEHFKRWLQYRSRKSNSPSLLGESSIVDSKVWMRGRVYTKVIARNPNKALLWTSFVWFFQIDKRGQ